MRRPNPSLMTPAQLDAAIEAEMAARPNGSPYADLLHDELDRRQGDYIEVADDYVKAELCTQAAVVGQCGWGCGRQNPI